MHTVFAAVSVTRAKSFLHISSYTPLSNPSSQVLMSLDEDCRHVCYCICWTVTTTSLFLWWTWTV